MGAQKIDHGVAAQVEGGFSPSGVNKAIGLIAAVALGVSIAVLLLSLGSPITDQHGFRQTQTAISVYWMLHGGPWLDYETPVLGYPWSIPFEFPLYQWIVAALVKTTGMALDPAGRIVSYAWLLLGLPPARVLFRSYGFPRETFAIYAALLLVSPLYLFWGRAFLMETQALTLSIWMLALVRRFTETPRAGTAILASLAAGAAGLTKLTTLPPFLLLAGLMILHALYRERADRGRLAAIFGGSAAIFLPALAVTALWTRHADALKAANPFGHRLQSSAPMMVSWNFGSLEQRVSPQLASAIWRAVSDVGGPACIVLLPIALGMLLLRKGGQGRREAGAALLMIAAFLVPFQIFTNLHIVHNYYQSANGALLVAALALTAAGVGARFGTRAMMLLVATIMLSQAVRFTFAFLPTMFHSVDRETAIASFVRGHSAPGSAIVTFGLDWSPVVPYYAERRALMIPDWKEMPLRERLLTTDRSAGGLEKGAFVICPSAIDRDPAAQGLLAVQLRGRTHARIAGCDIYS